MIRSTLALVAVLVATLSANAAPIIYTGSDPGVGPGGPRPNSDAARNSFLAATGALPTITFEGLAVGPIPGGGLSVATGVTMTTSNNNFGIDNSQSSTLGYNTTSGGANYARLQASTFGGTGSYVFTFLQPIDSFGAYFTGVGTVASTLDLLFNDGSAQTVSVPNSANGGVSFVGFTSFGNSIASITIRSSNQPNFADILGIDDVNFRASAIPEPATLAVFGGIALAGAFGYRRRKATASV